MTREQDDESLPSWWLKDAEALAIEFPYTFHKPSKQVISCLKHGNHAKLIFVFQTDDPEGPSGERMWVEITDVTDSGFVGVLDNQPEWIKDLNYRDTITFEANHIIDTDLDDPIPSFTERFQKRCFVTNKILYEGQKVGYFYREEPDFEDDSGWRFATGTEADEYMDDPENLSYVSLGAVLCGDDSFVDLLKLKAPIHFGKDRNGQFVKLD